MYSVSLLRSEYVTVVGYVATQVYVYLRVQKMHELRFDQLSFHSIPRCEGLEVL